MSYNEAKLRLATDIKYLKYVNDNDSLKESLNNKTKVKKSVYSIHQRKKELKNIYWLLLHRVWDLSMSK